MKNRRYFSPTRHRKLSSLLVIPALALVSLTSCIKEQYPVPNRTEGAYRVYRVWEAQISDVLSITDVLLKADQWLFATTQTEQEKAEDDYFRHFRLRQRGDTLYMQDYSLGRDYRLIYDSRELSEVGASRRFIRAAAGGYDTVHLVRMADAWQVRFRESDWEMSQQCRFELSVNKTMQNGKELWQVTGSGRFVWFDVPVGYDYTIDRKVIARNTSSGAQAYLNIYFHIASVVVTIPDTHSGTTYPIVAEKSDVADLRITYRGFTGYPYRY